MLIYHIFALILLIVGANAYPQYPDPDPNSFTRGRPIESIGTTTTASPTTASPRYLSCLQACPATSEYNPICGSDNINYYNPGRFDCAVRCGQAVQRRHLGICSTT